ncbi:hypothetical protein PBI_ROPE_98 [Mycobacterium phage Rope]|uniref:Uncharacterized protein n=2 Tax=Papyrusvirus TaxID=1982554 RepID=A0A1Z1LX05_9CAUD|nr:hypothetical protein SEA_ZENON_101 [Mycobacterium phage Zenon]QNN99759.1 hypothetical protein PBI_ROPE_98 [Mycobacterium phage Rope]
MTYARAALWFWVLATVAWTLLLAPSLLWWKAAGREARVRGKGR